MNKKYYLNLTGKVLEIVNPTEKCFIKIQIDSFLLDFPCSEDCDFHLEDKVFIESEILIKKISQFENLNNQSTNKNGGAR